VWVKMVRVSPQVPYTPKDTLVKKIDDSSALLKKKKIKQFFIKNIKKKKRRRIILFYTLVAYHKGPRSIHTNRVCALALLLAEVDQK
jgi:hypothetical protein